MNILTLQGRLAEARTAVEDYRRGSPESSFAVGLDGWLAASERDSPRAVDLFTQMRERNPDSRFYRLVTSRYLVTEYEKQGRLADARRIGREAMVDAEAQGDSALYVEIAAQLAGLNLRYGSDPAKAMAPLTGALKTHPLEAMDPLDRPYLWLVYAYARGARVDEARRLMRQYETEVPEGLRRSEPIRYVVAGRLAEAEKREDDALEAYREGYRSNGQCGTCGLYEIATIFDRRGQADSALANYERLLAHPSLIAALGPERYALSASYKRAGELYEAKGDRKKAADYYGRFVELWKNADPELQPAVREVRARLAQLAREPNT